MELELELDGDSLTVLRARPALPLALGRGLGLALAVPFLAAALRGALSGAWLGLAGLPAAGGLATALEVAPSTAVLLEAALLLAALLAALSAAALRALSARAALGWRLATTAVGSGLPAALALAAGDRLLFRTTPPLLHAPLSWRLRTLSGERGPRLAPGGAFFKYQGGFLALGGMHRSPPAASSHERG